MNSSRVIVNSVRDVTNEIVDIMKTNFRYAHITNCLRAFFHAWEGPMFNGLRSDSVALRHVWLGLPGGRFQSDGGLRITAATAW